MAQMPMMIDGVAVKAGDVIMFTGGTNCGKSMWQIVQPIPIKVWLK